jgi:hypothetical protein
MREDWNTHVCVYLQVLRGRQDMWRTTQGRPADEFFCLLKKGDFILHLPKRVKSFNISKLDLKIFDRHTVNTYMYD